LLPPSGPASLPSPANAVPGGPGGLGGAGHVPPGKIENSGFKPKLSTTAFGGAKDKDGSANWQPIEMRKRLRDWEVTETPDSFKNHQYRNLSEGMVKAGSNKRVENDAVKNAIDRAKALERVDQGLRRDAGREDKQNNMNLAQPAMNGGEAGLTADALARNRVVVAVLSSPPLIVREYAALRPGTDEADTEPSDTILWQPVIVLPGDGKARLNFFLGSAPGGYQVIVAGHTLDGRIGGVRGVIPVSP
jgi:hypothetical protein